MKRILFSTMTIYLILLVLTGSVDAEMARVKEYKISPQVTAIQLSSFRGSIRWIPVTSQEEARIVVEVIADGVSQNGVRNALLQVRIVENVDSSSILLEARRPALPAGVDYLEVNYVVYAQPGQFRQFKAQTTHGPIEIVSSFNSELTLINQHAPITLHSGRGSVDLQTNNAAIELGELALTLSSRVQTDNGSISGMVSFPPQGSFLFLTTNAPINIKVPPNTLGTFNLSSSLGTIYFNVAEELYNGMGSATIIRSKEPSITVITSNNTLTISTPDLIKP